MTLYCKFGRQLGDMGMSKNTRKLYLILFLAVALVFSHTFYLTTKYERVVSKDPVIRLMKTTSTMKPFNSTWTLTSAEVPLKRSRKESWIKLDDPEIKLLHSTSLHPLALDEPYASRIKGIRSRCEKQGAINPLVDLSGMIYDDNHKVVMCEIPKAACTSWKELMWNLLGYNTYPDQFDKAKLLLSLGYLPTLDRLNREEAIWRLATYTKFLVKRHPLERLVSAHSDKFTSRSPVAGFRLRVGRRIAVEQADAYMHSVGFNKTGTTNIASVERDPVFQQLSSSEQKEVREYVSRLNNGEISFVQLTDHVVKSSERGLAKLDIHWRPQTTLCNPCAINYDYVIDFDHLTRDSNRLLDYLQRDKPNEWRLSLKEKNAAIKKTAVDSAFASISDQTIQKLREVYQKDFCVLGYDW